jgi:hypothetical protein
MIEEEDFETYLSISKDKFQIIVFDIKNSKNLFSNETIYDNKKKFQILEHLVDFLDTNIFKIEKLISTFVRNITFVIDRDENLSVDICVKKKNYDELINHKNLENMLIEAKDIFKENYQDQRITHIVISNYLVNGKKYSTFINNLHGNDLCLEINFSSISNEFISSLEKILEKYQIKISQFLNGNYIKNFFNRTKLEPSEMIFKIKHGYNVNEVLLVPKNDENKGFFEKFFQLFS